MEGTKELAGKVAVITGSARNMGRAFAEALAKSGASVAVRAGLYVDSQVTRGSDRTIKGWGFALRVTY